MAEAGEPSGEIEGDFGVHVRPVLREVVAEASRSLACLDAERLEELVLSCQALNRDLDAGDEERRKGLALEAEESFREMAIFARVLEATRANMGVMKGTGDNSNAGALANLANQLAVGGMTASNFYSSFVTTLGSTVSEVQTENAAQNASVTQLQMQGDALSSVNLNDEAALMQQIERSYQAASQVFTMLNTIMGSAINLGVTTAV